LDEEQKFEPEDPRTRFAGERTLLAWIRTGLSLMGFGFVVARFGLFLREISAVRGGHSASMGLSVWIGTALVVLGVLVNFSAAVEHRRFLHGLELRRPYAPPRWSMGFFVALLVAVIGLLMAAYLVFAESTASS
jgi:putative membrane protein